MVRFPQIGQVGQVQTRAGAVRKTAAIPRQWNRIGQIGQFGQVK